MSHLGPYISIWAACNGKPKFKKISWTNDNVKSLGVHHGYNVFFCVIVYFKISVIYKRISIHILCMINTQNNIHIYI